MIKKLLYVSLIVVTLGFAKSVESNTSTIPFYIYNAATSFEIDVDLMYALCRVESNCRPNAINHDDGRIGDKESGIVKKSYGLFQIQLATAKALGFIDKEIIATTVIKKGKSYTKKKIIYHRKDLLKPETNAWYAAKLLRHLYDKYDDTLKVISAYNAGRPVRYNKEYVNKVLRHYVRYKIDKKH